MFYTLGAVEADSPHAQGGYALRFLGRDSRLDACLVLQPLSPTVRQRLARLSHGAHLTLAELAHLAPGLRSAEFTAEPIDGVPNTSPHLASRLTTQLDGLQVMIVEVPEDRPFVPRLMRSLEDLAAALKAQLAAARLDPVNRQISLIRTSAPERQFTLHALEDGSWWVSDEQNQVVKNGTRDEDPTEAIGDWLLNQGLSGWSFSRQ